RDEPFGVTASTPADGATEVATDMHVALRFSAPVAGVAADALTLTGPQGVVPTRVVFAEQQRLAFVSPLQLLDSGAADGLRVSGLTDVRGVPLAPTIVTFTTVAARDASAAASTPEEWIPDAKSRTNGWRTDRPPSPWEALPPLTAPPGVTAIAGRVLTLDG